VGSAGIPALQLEFLDGGELVGDRFDVLVIERRQPLPHLLGQAQHDGALLGDAYRLVAVQRQVELLAGKQAVQLGDHARVDARALDAAPLGQRPRRGGDGVELVFFGGDDVGQDVHFSACGS
jgi:hypothetical protein